MDKINKIKVKKELKKLGISVVKGNYIKKSKIKEVLEKIVGNVHTLEIGWGVTKEEGKPSKYSFGSKKELDAFLYGVEEAAKWADCDVVQHAE